MSLETQIILGMAGTLVGTVIVLLFCLWLSDGRAARQSKVPIIPKCVMRQTPTTAYICSWCPDSKEGGAYAERQNLMPSHGICPACREKNFPGLRKSTPPACTPNSNHKKAFPPPALACSNEHFPPAISRARVPAGQLNSSAQSANSANSGPLNAGS